MNYEFDAEKVKLQLQKKENEPTSHFEKDLEGLKTVKHE